MGESLTCDQIAPVDTDIATTSSGQWLKPEYFQFSKCCQICDESFSISSPYVICPECRKRLKAMLYPLKPEENSEDSQKIG